MDARFSLVMTTELTLVLTVLGLVEAESSLVMTTELASVLTVLGLVEAELSLVAMVSLSITVTSVVGDAVSREVESPGLGAGDVAGVTVPRTVESPGPGALSSTCFSLGSTKVPSYCKRALDNLDWSKYEPVRWTLAMTMRMTTFISATC